MYTKEQMEQFERDRAFIAEGYAAQNKQKIEEQGKPLEAAIAYSPVSTGTPAVKKPSRFTQKAITYTYLQENSWVRLAVAACCVLLAISLFFPWLGKRETGIALAFTAWSPTTPSGFGYGCKIAAMVFCLVLPLILLFMFAAKKTFPDKSDVFFGIPAITITVFFISTYLGAYQAQPNNILSMYGFGFRLACIISALLLMIGILIRLHAKAGAFTLPPDSIWTSVKQYVYYLFILTGVSYACIAWPLSKTSGSYFFNPSGSTSFTVFQENFSSLMGFTWPYFAAAAFFWFAFRRQFVRVWFHLVAFYAFILVGLNLFWKDWPITRELSFAHLGGYITAAMFHAIPYVVSGAALLSFYIGLHRSCPACFSLFGKKLLSYTKTGTTETKQSVFKHITVGEYKTRIGGDYVNVTNMRDNELILVREEETIVHHNYDTSNICKNCGHTWTDKESHQGCYVPM